MLPSQHRLTRRAEIAQTIRHGRRARRGALVVHLLIDNGHAGPARAAFAVNKAVGDSVVRHRVVRRLRAVTLPVLARLPVGTDLVVRAMPEAATTSSTQLRVDLERALEGIAPLTQAESPAAPQGEDLAFTASTLESPAPTRSGVGRVLWWVGWPVRSLLLALVWVYRHTITPILPPTCRYHPSCSAYGFEALQVHGAAKGVILTGWRVLRCNPFSLGGLDPVPAKGTWRPDINPDGTPRDTACPPA